MLTPTTTDPIVATLFAAESARFGSAVVLIGDYDKCRKIAGPGNQFVDLEREVIVRVSPLDFQTRHVQQWITLEMSRIALGSIGIEVPVLIGNKKALRDWLTDTPRLHDEQIAEYLRSAGVFYE